MRCHCDHDNAHLVDVEWYLLLTTNEIGFYIFYTLCILPASARAWVYLQLWNGQNGF